ncbi:MAG: Type 1 glutamine amidotransferase-like domain-containing protein [Chloroflexota bacterium]
MTGRVALHGGGEFLPGDERFLDALLRTATTQGRAAPLRIVIVPTAAARGRPDLAASNGVQALRRRAAALGIEVEASIARIVDAATAAEPDLIDSIARADLVYLPGGDPDLIPTLFRDTAAGRALRHAHASGGVIAGASAGAMGLAEWTWTPAGGIRGLGLVPGIAVFPHYDESVRARWQAKLAGIAPADLGYLGLDERTGVIGGGNDWVVAGEGAARWFPAGASDPIVVVDGGRLELLSGAG